MAGLPMSQCDPKRPQMVPKDQNKMFWTVWNPFSNVKWSKLLSNNFYMSKEYSCAMDSQIKQIYGRDNQKSDEKGSRIAKNGKIFANNTR